MLRDVSLRIIDFVCLLERHHLEQFWLPYTAHLLVTTATIVLRCIVETENEEVRNTCKTSIRKFLQHLRSARHDLDWDIAEIFLERCEEAINRITESEGQGDFQQSAGNQPILSEQVPEDVLEDPTSLIDGSLFAPADSLDCIWGSLWDVFDEPMALQL
jgi:hypothetical protein